MDLNRVRIGMMIITIGKLNSTDGMFVVQRHIDARQPNKEGVITGYVPGHGGDVFWIRHNDGTVGAYAFDEFYPV